MVNCRGILSLRMVFLKNHPDVIMGAEPSPTLGGGMGLLELCGCRSVRRFNGAMKCCKGLFPFSAE